MSDESTVMPDSSSLSHSDVDSQPVTREAEDKGAEGSVDKGSSKETQPKANDYSVLEKRLADTEAALKERQREFTEASLKMAELKGQMSAMVKPEPEPDALGELIDADFDSRFVENPTATVKELAAKQQRQFGKVLQQRDEYWRNEMKTMLDEQLNPDRAEYRDTIKELSKQAWFTKLSPNEQLDAAKTVRGKSSGETVNPPATSPGGTGRRTPPNTRTADEERKANAKAIMESSFPMNDNSTQLMPEVSVSVRRSR